MSQCTGRCASLSADLGLARAEIERLRSDLGRTRAQSGVAEHDHRLALGAVRVENDRLRAHLNMSDEELACVLDDARALKAEIERLKALLNTSQTLDEDDSIESWRRIPWPDDFDPFDLPQGVGYSWLTVEAAFRDGFRLGSGQPPPDPEERAEREDRQREEAAHCDRINASTNTFPNPEDEL